MPVSDDPKSPGPLEVTLVGAPPASGSAGRRLWHDVLLVLLSVTLSGAVAFGVARYTVAADHDDQTRAATQQRLSAVYLPLSAAVARVIACISPGVCTEEELRSAYRDTSGAIVAVLGQGSEKMAARVSAFESSLRAILRARFSGKRPNGHIASRAGRQFNALESQISRELEG